MKDIKSYIHLYIGCRAKTTGGKYGKIVSASVDGTAIIVYDNEDPRGFVISIAALKLILRPLDEMSDAESTVYAQLGDSDFNKAVGRKDYYAVDKMAAHQVFWAIKKGFDLFDLKDAGLAVYETEIKK